MLLICLVKIGGIKIGRGLEVGTVHTICYESNLNTIHLFYFHNLN